MYTKPAKTMNRDIDNVINEDVIEENCPPNETNEMQEAKPRSQTLKKPNVNANRLRKVESDPLSTEH